MDKQDIKDMRAWADAKITAGTEPAEAWFQYMKLRETLDQLLEGTAIVRTENLPESEHDGTGPRLAVSNRPSNVQPLVPVTPTLLPK